MSGYSVTISDYDDLRETFDLCDDELNVTLEQLIHDVLYKDRMDKKKEAFRIKYKKRDYRDWFFAVVQPPPPPPPPLTFEDITLGESE